MQSNVDMTKVVEEVKNSNEEQLKKLKRKREPKALKMPLLSCFRREKMSKILNFTKRNFKELLREPIICIFCLACPVVMLALFQIINN